MQAIARKKSALGERRSSPVPMGHDVVADEVVVANGSSASIGSWAVELLFGSVAEGVQCGYYSGWRRYSFAILRAG
jgi:hypothetical protein